MSRDALVATIEFLITGIITYSPSAILFLEKRGILNMERDVLYGMVIKIKGDDMINVRKSMAKLHLGVCGEM